MTHAVGVAVAAFSKLDGNQEFIQLCVRPYHDAARRHPNVWIPQITVAHD
jgi:hypothetical protein